MNGKTMFYLPPVVAAALAQLQGYDDELDDEPEQDDEPAPDWHDHPSLSPSERNPNLR